VGSEAQRDLYMVFERKKLILGLLEACKERKNKSESQGGYRGQK